MDAIDTVRDVATRVMAETIGDVSLGEATPLDSSDRSALVRFVVEEGPSGAPASIIVKRTLGMGAEGDDPAAFGTPTARFISEWASLAFLGEVAADQPVAPRLYGADRASGLIVMEDVGTVRSLSDSLLGDDPADARADLLAYAETVGRMHARSAPHVARFREIRDSLGPPVPGFDQGWIAPAFHAMRELLGVTASAGIDDELASVTASITHPGELVTFVHGDPCPDNWTLVGDGNRLLDFEFSSIGPALLDGAYGTVTFPSCWCVGALPDPVAREVARAYRVALAEGCPAARDDDRYARAEAEACVFWLVMLCRDNPLTEMLEEDWEWGTASIRQRLVTRLEVVADRSRFFPAIGDAASAMANELRRRWAGEVEPMPLYAAFRA